MVKIDIGRAAFSGFGVIGRNPLAVFVWALFLAVVGLLPALALMGTVFSSISQMILADRHGTEPTPEMIMPMVGSLIAIIPLMMLANLVMRMVLTGAVYRAVLFPGDSGWFYMRLGARELWLALMFIVMGIIAGVVMMAMLTLVIPAVFISQSSGHHDPMMTMLMVRAGMLPAYAVLIFLVVRFGLALPMTFAESKFRLLESWSLTRGNSWRILLVLLLLVAIAFIMELAIVLIVIACVLSVAGFGAASGAWTEERFTAMLGQDPTVWMHTLVPWILGFGLLGCLLGALLTVIFTAPFADIYRQLRSEPDVLI